MGHKNITTDFVIEAYENLMARGDPRTADWLFVESPVPAVSAVLAYIAVCKVGPRLMRNREPVDLGHLLTVYNFTLVALSAYMCYEFFMSAYLANYTLVCQLVDYSTNTLALRMANVCWFYYFSKYIELLDTVFFIMRKKFNQMTFLHIFHHASMVFNWWLCVKFVAGGPTFFHAMVNSFVHVVMYSYYGLSALGPSLQPYLWWKKYVTKIQVVQFVMIILHVLINWIMCDISDFPLGFICLCLFYAFMFLFLFSNFYYQAYVNKKRRLAESSDKQKKLD